MSNLIKYELIKSKAMLTVGFAAMVLIEIFFLIGIYVESVFWLGFVLFIMLAGFGMTALLIYSIILLTMDISKKQGYMVFMTPNSAYKILGSKLIVSFMVLASAFLLYFAMAVMNLYLLGKANLDFDTEFVTILFNGIPNWITAEGVFYIFLVSFAALFQWFLNIMMIYFAIILTYTFLANIKFKGIIAFLVYIGINIVVNIITSLPKMLATGDLLELTTNSTSQMQTTFDMFFDYSLWIVMIVINLVIASGLYLLTAYITDKKLSM